MASGISAALGYYLIGVQSAKGVVATTWFKFRASAESTLAPDKVVNRYHMTDSGRDEGDAFTSVVSVKGAISTYLHPDGVAIPFYLALGSVADSGAGPNYTHTLSPADDLPWFSAFRVVGGVITEQMLDCKLNMLTVEAEAGDAPEATWDIFGITPTWAAEPVGPTAIVGDPYKFYEGKNALKVNAVPIAMHKWKFEVNNNLSPYQADDYFLSDIDPGKRQVSFDYSAHFTGPTSEPKYREFMYGSDAGTTVSTALVSKPHEVTLTRDANTSIDILMPQARTAAVPVNPNPDGNAIDVEVATVVEKPVGSDIVTVTVKDQAATVG